MANAQRGLKMRTNRMEQAEAMRYGKIQRLMDLLCPKPETVSADLLDDLTENGLCTPFHVGKQITVEDSNIIIKKIAYHPSELQKVTMNTEGSMCIYDSEGKRLCDWRNLNVSMDNVELFCLWVRKQNISAEIVSGKRERIFQWSVFTVGILAIILFRILRLLCK